MRLKPNGEYIAPRRKYVRKYSQLPSNDASGLAKGQDSRYHIGGDHMAFLMPSSFRDKIKGSGRSRKEVPLCGRCNCESTTHDIYQQGDRGGPCRCGCGGFE